MNPAPFFAEYPRISAALMHEPWAIIPAHHQSMVEQLGAYIANPAAAPMAGIRLGGRSELPAGALNSITTYDAASGLGIISARGVIGKGLSQLAMDCGGLDLNQIEDGLDQMRGMKPKAVAIHFNSPGGAVTGVQECAAAIESFGAQVAPVFGYTDTMAASAAYWLACSCDMFHAAGSALVGSIGVYSSLVDSSAEAAAAGRKVYVVTSGAQKARGYPGVPVTPEHLTAVQAGVQRAEARFFGHVSARRQGVNGAEAFTGDYWPAQDAPFGLTDGFIRSRGDHLAFVLQTVAATAPRRP